MPACANAVSPAKVQVTCSVSHPGPRGLPGACRSRRGGRPTPCFSDSAERTETLTFGLPHLCDKASPRKTAGERPLISSRIPERLVHPAGKGPGAAVRAEPPPRGCGAGRPLRAGQGGPPARPEIASSWRAARPRVGSGQRLSHSSSRGVCADVAGSGGGAHGGLPTKLLT